MKPIGDCLTFRMKWNQEISKIIASEGELEELENPAHTRKLVTAVEGEARSQAADLLEACGHALAAHFSSIGDERIATEARNESRPQVEKGWSLTYGVWPADKRRPRGKVWRMKVGVNLQEIEPNHFYLLPWIWVEGGEDRLRFQLKQKLCEGKSSDFEWEEGQLPLAKILLMPLDTVPTLDELVEKTREAGASITKEELGYLYP